MKFLRKQAYCDSENGVRKLFADTASLECKSWSNEYVTFAHSCLVCSFVCLLIYE